MTATTVVPLDMALTSEQQQYRESVRGFIRAHRVDGLARAQHDSATSVHDPALWKRLAGELGAVGICAPEQYGGMGGDIDDLCILAEELGAVLAPGPFLVTAGLAVPLLAAVTDEGLKRTWLTAVAAGDCVATVAFADARSPRPGHGVQATRRGLDWHLDGRAALVLDADVADLVIVVAVAPDGPRLFAVPVGAVEVQAQESIDPTRRLSAVVFDGVAATHLPVGDVAGVLDECLDRFMVALAAEQVGGARACLAQAVEYSLQRHQFGRPIGSFQAIQHLCADVYIDLEAATSAVYYAAWAIADGAAERRIAASVARCIASELITSAAAANVQIHGTMGYTQEHDAQLFYRRAKWSSAYLGSPSSHRDRIADLLRLTVRTS